MNRRETLLEEELEEWRSKSSKLEFICNQDQDISVESHLQHFQEKYLDTSQCMEMLFSDDLPLIEEVPVNALRNMPTPAYRGSITLQKFKSRLGDSAFSDFAEILRQKRVL